MAYTSTSNESGLQTLLNRRLAAAAKIVAALECQSGLDMIPAQAALPRILTGVFKKSGYKFKHVGHGRMRDVFEVVSSDESLNLVLKLGNKQATARDIALTLAFPDDRAQIYAATEYGVVAERVDCITKISDPRLQTEAFKKRIEQFAERYIGVSYEDVGYINGNTVADLASRIVVIGSSTRVIKKDAAVKGSASQQIHIT
jgi:hypothetical protein